MVGRTDLLLVQQAVAAHRFWWRRRLSKHTPTPLPISTHAPILLVDDDDGLRNTVGLLLTEAGYEVAEADTIIDALRWLRAAPSGQVVLLDFVLTWHLNADLLL